MQYISRTLKNQLEITIECSAMPDYRGYVRRFFLIFASIVNCLKDRFLPLSCSFLIASERVINDVFCFGDLFSDFLECFVSYWTEVGQRLKSGIKKRRKRKKGTSDEKISESKCQKFISLSSTTR